MMKLRLEQRADGQWQADVWTPDGNDHHAIGKEPWEALIRLGQYWESLPRTRETYVDTPFGRVVMETRP